VSLLSTTVPSSNCTEIRLTSIVLLVWIPKISILLLVINNPLAVILPVIEIKVLLPVIPKFEISNKPSSIPLDILSEAAVVPAITEFPQNKLPLKLCSIWLVFLLLLNVSTSVTCPKIQ
jgi:hypothetical protein